MFITLQKCLIWNWLSYFKLLFPASFTLCLFGVDAKCSGGLPWWHISYPKHIRDNLNRCHNMLQWTKINQHRWAELHWKWQRGRYSGLAIWSCVTIPAGMIYLWDTGVLHLFTYLILAHPVWLLLLNNSGNNCEGVEAVSINLRSNCHLPKPCGSFNKKERKISALLVLIKIKLPTTHLIYNKHIQFRTNHSCKGEEIDRSNNISILRAN